MQIAPTDNPIEAARVQERIARIEGELEDLNTRVDALVEAVRLLAPQHWSPPWSDSRISAELHRATANQSVWPTEYDDDRR